MDNLPSALIISATLLYLVPRLSKCVAMVAIAIAYGQNKEVQKKIQKEWDKISEA